MQSSIPNLPPGTGRISLTSYGSNAVLSELSSTYPLKLISPHAIHRNVAVVYSLSYGGGLVGGDRVNVSIKVDKNAILVVRSQGSTKVFKTRPETRLASVRYTQQKTRSVATISSPESSSLTMQTMNATIAAQGAMFLLPDPVTCFRSASYAQKQIFHLSNNASLLVIDWITSGRSSMGEEWVFARYHSINDVWVEGERIAKDVMLLDEPGTDTPILPARSMGDRLAPYSCYATVILWGPLVQSIIEKLTFEYDQISVFKAKIPTEIIWSFSPLTSKGGAIVRVAGKETETVKRWLGEALITIQDTVGVDVYRNTFLS